MSPSLIICSKATWLVETWNPRPSEKEVDFVFHFEGTDGFEDGTGDCHTEGDVVRSEEDGNQSEGRREKQGIVNDRNPTRESNQMTVD